MAVNSEKIFDIEHGARFIPSQLPALPVLLSEDLESLLAKAREKCALQALWDCAHSYLDPLLRLAALAIAPRISQTEFLRARQEGFKRALRQGESYRKARKFIIGMLKPSEPGDHSQTLDELVRNKGLNLHAVRDQVIDEILPAELKNPWGDIPQNIQRIANFLGRNTKGRADRYYCLRQVGSVEMPEIATADRTDDPICKHCKDTENKPCFQVQCSGKLMYLPQSYHKQRVVDGFGNMTQ